MRTLRHASFSSAIVFLLALIGFSALAASDVPPQPEDIISFLNQTIVWHRQLVSQQQLVSEPSDAIFLNDSHEIADQVVRLSFDFARAEARRIASQAKLPLAAGTADQAQPPAPQYQNLAAQAALSNQRVKQTQDELEGLKRQAASATGKKRQILESSIAEVQSELDLMQVRRDALQSMLEFAHSTAASSSEAGGLQSRIEELARTAHAGATEEKDTKQKAAHDGAAPDTTPVAIATAGDRKSDSGGIFTLLTDLLELRRKLRLLDTSLELTDSLAQTSRTLRAPLIANIRELARRGDDTVNQPDSQDPDVLAQQRKELDSLTAQFKQLLVVSLPLSKQGILLDEYKHNLSNWRTVVQGQYSVRGKSLLWRLAILVAVLVVVFATADLWRRATFRYVQDVRRRHQFLIMRRIIVWPLALLIVVLSVASGLGSITTFAGLLTAGVAVSLQNVILAVVGYFLLIGKYGVRVGDRIQIAGVTGNVTDIGLVRMHVVEVSGPGSRPTGRVVAFSNAVVFQPDAAIFKQIPGTNFVWHEVSLSPGPEVDYRRLEETMLQAVNRIFADYSAGMEQQRQGMQRAVSILPATTLHPESLLRLLPAGIEVAVRYPVELDSAAAVDDRVIREVLNATGHQPKLQTAEPGGETTLQEQSATKEL